MKKSTANITEKSNTLALGIDIGGTKSEVCILRFRGGSYKELIRTRCETKRLQGYDFILKNISILVLSALQKTKIKPVDIQHCGIGLPGSVNPSSGKMTFGNTLALRDKNIARDLKAAVGLKCRVVTENDANCFALAEALNGAGLTFAKKMKIDADKLISVGIILGTGTGGGTIIEGKILKGARGGASEVGHTELHEHGLSCYCGRSGCAENYLSGPALESHFARRLYSQSPKPLSGQEIFKLSELGDPIAKAVVLQYKHDLAKFLGSLINVFDPHYFVLGGGLSNQDEIYEGLSQMLTAHSFLPGSPPPVLKNKLGDSAGVIGAALCAVQNATL